MSRTSKSPRRVAAVVLAVGERGLPRDAHRVAPKTFTQPRLFACLVLMRLYKADYGRRRDPRRPPDALGRAGADAPPARHRLAESHPRTTKDVLARVIVEQMHGPAAASAEFRRRLTDHQPPTDLETRDVPTSPIGIVERIRHVGLAASNSEARRLIEQGAVTLADKKVTDPAAEVALDDHPVLRVGKRRVCRVTAKTRTGHVRPSRRQEPDRHGPWRRPVVVVSGPVPLETCDVQQFIDAVRIMVCRLLVAAWSTRTTRWYYQRARYLACHGSASKTVAGLTANFHVDSVGDYEHTAGPLFEAEQIEAFLGSLNERDVVYEVGGHIGTWAVLTGMKVPRGSVEVFEPEPVNYNKLTQNIRRNSLGNVRCHQVAAGASEGEATLGATTRGGDGQHSLVVRDIHERATTVPVVALDSVPDRFGTPAPTALKIDCEGYELEVLKGMSRLLRSGAVRVVMIEVHPPYLAQMNQRGEDVVKVLTDAGYQPARSWKRRQEQIYLFKRAGTAGTSTRATTLAASPD